MGQNGPIFGNQFTFPPVRSDYQITFDFTFLPFLYLLSSTMLAINFGSLSSAGRKRDPSCLFGETATNERIPFPSF